MKHAVNLKIHFFSIVLLAGCAAQPQKETLHKVDSKAFSSVTSSSTSSSLSISSQKMFSSQSSITTATSNKQTSVSSTAPLKSSSLPNSSFMSNSSLISKPSTSSNSAVTSSRSALTSLGASSQPTTSKGTLVAISGVIKITGKNGEVISPDGVIVNLEPINAVNEPIANQEKRQYDVYMKNKSYTPKLMTVKQSDQLTFTNKDKIKHNVFSTTAGNGFDLGTYGEGGKNNAVLKTPGIVKVYCNIHPEMALFISVSPHNYSAITDASGAYEINNLPPGEYILSAWNIRGEIQQTVNLQTLKTKKDIVINTESYVPTQHKNKFGEDYKKKSALFEDEFY